MGKKRLFVAVDLPEDVKKELSIICEHFKKRELFIGRCTRSENLHLTLKFIGPVAESVIQKIDQALKNIYVDSCNATLSNLGVLPTRRISRILFAGLDCFCLPILAKQIEQSFLEQGLSWIKSEEREFKNHITLARIKKIENKEDFLYAVDNFGVPPLEFKIKEFVLKQSELTPEGPVYTILGRYKLY